MDQPLYDPSSYDLTSRQGFPYAPIDAVVQPGIDSGVWPSLSQFTVPPDQAPFLSTTDPFVDGGLLYAGLGTFNNGFVLPQDQYESATAAQRVVRRLNQPARTRNRVTPQEWQSRKRCIKEYYYHQNLSLHDTMDIMESKGFYASKRRYKEQIKHWGWEKNLSTRQRRWVTKKALSRRKYGKKVEITMNQRMISLDKIDRYCRNHTRSEYSATGETVSGIGYSRTPPPAHEHRTPPPAHEVYSQPSFGDYDALQSVQDTQQGSPVYQQHAQQMTLSGLVNPTRGNDSIDLVIAENMALFTYDDM